jgi:hypothetical protein
MSRGAKAGTGVDGVRILDGAEAILDNVTITGFTDAGARRNPEPKPQMCFGMTSHEAEAVNNTGLVLRNVEAARCGGSGFRCAAATVNMAVENSLSSGNNLGFEKIAGNLRIANCGMYFNNTNCSVAVLSAGNNRSAGNTTTEQSDAGWNDHPLTAPARFAEKAQIRERKLE